MNNWEENIRDMMEGYESPLPEGSLAEFHARRKARAKAASIKRMWPVWLATAAAAAICVPLFLNHPQEKGRDHQTINQSTEEMVVEASVPIIDESPATEELPLPEPPTDTSTRHSNVRKFAPDTNQRQTAVPVEVYSSSKQEGPTEEIQTSFEEVVSGQPPCDNTGTLIIPELPQNVVKPAPARRRITGSILVAAGQLPAAGGGTASLFAPKTSPSGYSHTHYLPVKAGITASVPISNKISITTGINYSLYMSSYTYRISPTQFGENLQYVHYLGIPVCLNWKFVSTGSFDFYAGAGVEKAFFFFFFLAGSKIKKDGGYLSLLGSGGVQWNASKLIGLYLEPSMSWSFMPEPRITETYLTEHPFTFLIATGIRINLNNR